MLDQTKTVCAAETRQHGLTLLPISIGVSPQPEVFLVRINGRAHRIRRWSADEWDRTPESKRPAQPLVGDRGGRLTIEPANKI